MPKVKNNSVLRCIGNVKNLEPTVLVMVIRPVSIINFPKSVFTKQQKNKHKKVQTKFVKKVFAKKRARSKMCRDLYARRGY